MSMLAWRRVTMRFGATTALDAIELSLERGEVLALLGPSGCGKTTLLRVTAGLEAPTAGSVHLDGADLAGVPPHRRGFGLVFQDYCLFPHLDVAGNVAYGLRMARWPRPRIRARVKEMLRLVRLEGFEGRSVLSLSGGEQQRVALARGLAPEPRLLMLDEPLGALDATLRAGLLAELPAILSEAGATALYVTHEQDEALAVAHRIAVMRRGRILQCAGPSELVDRPAGAFVAGFLDLGALVPVRARHGGRLETPLGELGPPADARTPSDGGPGPRSLLLIRHGAAAPLCRDPAAPCPRATARVTAVLPGPTGVRLGLALLGDDGGSWNVWCAWQPGAEGQQAPPHPGALLTVGLDQARMLEVADDR